MVFEGKPILQAATSSDRRITWCARLGDLVQARAVSETGCRVASRRPVFPSCVPMSNASRRLLAYCLPRPKCTADHISDTARKTKADSRLIEEVLTQASSAEEAAAEPLRHEPLDFMNYTMTLGRACSSFLFWHKPKPLPTGIISP